MALELSWLVTLLSSVVTICTASLTLKSSTFYPHCVFMCFVWISEQTAIISLYSINWLVFITETGCVYYAVRTGPLNIILFSNNWNSGLYQTVVCGVPVPSIINGRKKGRKDPCLAMPAECRRSSLLCYSNNPNSTLRVAASQRQRFDPPRMRTGRQVTSRLPHTLKATSR